MDHGKAHQRFRELLVAVSLTEFNGLWTVVAAVDVGALKEKEQHDGAQALATVPGALTKGSGQRRAPLLRGGLLPGYHPEACT